MSADPAALRAESEHVRWVRQEDAGGCALATAAMICGISYEEAKVEGDAAPCNTTKPDWSNGTSHITLDYILGEHGFYGRRTYISWFQNRIDTGEDQPWRWEMKPGATWPPEPFAPIHYATVEQPSNNSHFVVMLADGRVLDPLREGYHHLSDWSTVSNVRGLVRP